VFYSYEMSLVEITARCVSMLLAERGIRVPYTVIRGKRDKLHEMEKVKDALDILDGLPLIIVIANGMTIDTLRADVLRQKTKLALTGKRLTLAVIDYLGLIRAPEKVRERIQQIGYISRSIKDMAKHAGIPVLTLAQLNRALEGRQDKRPQLSDLRESGDIEQDADTVMFIHRESYYLARDAGKASNPGHQMTVETSMGDAEVIVSKNRHGPVKVVKVGVDLPVNRFFDLHEEGATY
jgi:replicative DNA helicase